MEWELAGAKGSMLRIVRRRRTRRHLRNRRIRRLLLLTFLVTTFAVFLALASHDLGPWSASQARNSGAQKIDLSQDLLQLDTEQMLRSAESRPEYPYSVIPGGIRDVEELKWAAAHDPVVRAHYAGFDYDRARVVRLVLARTAYVSYRIGNKIYWTRRRITLHRGDSVITDGKITARMGCGNRVEGVPQQLSSIEEPPPILFDEPKEPLLGPAIETPPTLYHSTLSHPPDTPPLGVYQPIAGGVWIPISPPPLPGVCGIGKKGTGGTGGGGRKKGTPCAPSGGKVPEPSTWLLVASGAGLLVWRLRDKDSIWLGSRRELN